MASKQSSLERDAICQPDQDSRDVPGGPLGTHGGFGHAECFGVPLF